ncbi:MAG: 2-phosphosulfolactate phosphatase family protein [Cyanobacteria bacterium RM1_2_2]|nr:2-phosphosulfolactate phosphatase family protein [Cyanobacteria bacterium RM1_2_2]
MLFRLQLCSVPSLSLNPHSPVKVSIYHTPELTPNGSLPACAIAVDVLRATTTMATALSAGAEAVQVFSNMDELMQVSEQWTPENRLRAGERGGAKVPGCDLGNSPLDCTPEVVKGRRLFISTTNGTRCLERIQNADTVLTAALINREAVVNYLLSHRPETVWIVGSGWEGSFSLEDTVCAGAIVHQLGVRLSDQEHPLETIADNDEVFGAVALYRQWQNNLLGLLHHASHGQRLLRLDCYDDLKYCAQTDTLDVLPIQTQPGILVKQAD